MFSDAGAGEYETFDWDELDAVRDHMPDRDAEEDEVDEGKKCPQCGSTECTCPPGECDCDPVDESDMKSHYVEEYDWECEKCGHENVFGMTQQEADEYIENWERENPDEVENGHSGESVLDWNMNVIGPESEMHRGQKCSNCGTIHESVNSAVEETATNALDAALAELKSLAGL